MTSDANWWRGSVTYQVYPRSFQDSNGDGIGDITGITQRLPYIASLGVDAVWLSPVFTSPMADMGYDVSNYTDIDALFGTLEDFDAMMSVAHCLGLKVIIDQVLSHSSHEHPFFQESRQSRDNPKADWYVWADPNLDGTPPNNWQAIFNGGGAWEWEPRRQQYYFHNFLKEQPDFNFHNPEVQEWLLSVLRFWLDRGVDGFRLDTVNFYFHDLKLRNNPADYVEKTGPVGRLYDMQYPLFSKNQPENLDFLKKLRAVLDEYPGRTLIGEIGDHHHGTELMAAYTSDNRLHMAYSFDLLSDEFSASHFRHHIETFFDKAQDGWPCWAFSNHDVSRHPSRWAEHGITHKALAKQSATLLLSLQGSVCIYQGEELGQSETELAYDELTDPQGLNYWPADKGRDGCRTPMVWDDTVLNGGFTSAEKPWLPIKRPQLANAVSLQEDASDSVLNHYRRMLHLRREIPELRDGKTRFLETEEPVLAFMRGQRILCLFNLSPHPQSLAIEGIGDVLLNEGGTVENESVTLHPNAALIIEVRSSVAIQPQVELDPELKDKPLEKVGQTE
ncbi:oligo-1,6-glucosidase [Rhodobacteraceae bacterium KLH11]|nr:oligo-1,6-glucosidase [Rhodobacteraceae bacterium KLH11]